MKTRQDDDMTDHKDVISTEYDIEMIRLKGQCVWSMTKTRQDNDMTDSSSILYVENEAKLL